MPTFLLVTHGSDGDVLPFVRVGAELAGRGHEVVLLTHAPFRAAAVAAGLDFVPIDAADGYERTLAATPHLLGQQRMSWQDFYQGNGLFDQIRRECDAIVRRCRPGATVLVGRHTSAVSVRFVAEMVGAPVAWIAVSPTQVMAAPVAAHTYGTELAAEFDELRDGLGLAPITDWQAWFTRSTVEIGLWPAWFDEAGYRSPARVALLGFPLADESSDPGADGPGPDGDASGPVTAAGTVLATGGTGRMLHADYYPRLIEGLALAGHPTVLVVRHRDLLPAALPPNVRWRPRLSFPHVMPLVAAVAHHGGIGTCVRALAAGTPQVLLPDGIDRPDNASRLHRRDLARVLPADAWDPPAIAAAVTAAVNDRGYRVRALAATGGEYADGVARAADRLEALRDPASLSARVRALGAGDRDQLRARLGARAALPTPGGDAR